MAKKATGRKKSSATETDVLHVLLPILAQKFDLDDIFKTVSEKAISSTKAASCVFYMVDHETGVLRVFPASRKKIPKNLKTRAGLAVWTIKHRETVVLKNAEKDERYSDRIDLPLTAVARSVFCAPILIEGAAVGCVQAVGKAFGKKEQRFLETIATVIAIAVRKTKNIAKIEELTITDDLTGLYNSRYLHRMIEMEIRRAQRYSEEFSIVFIDLDRFKQVNDTYGHLVGSRILKETSKIISEGLRMDIDAAFRYGGDEFVLVLPKTGHEGATVVAKRIQAIIRTRVFSGDKGERFRLTASFGIAAYPRDATTREEVIRLADEAMYDAKKRGRDGIQISR